MTAVKAAQAAIYKARWVDAFGPNAVIATDEMLAKAAIEALAPWLVADE